MNDFLQLVLSGLATGAIYALIALGFVLLWQTSGTINFAQGDFVMVPACMMVSLGYAGMPWWLSLLLTLVASVGTQGWLFQRGLIDRLLRSGPMPVIVGTIGLAITLRNLVRVSFGAEAHAFPNLFPDQVYRLAGVSLSAYDIGTLLCALLLMLMLHGFLQYTLTGRAMQAVAQNREAAQVIGIPVSRMVFYTFAINAVLTTTAALLVTPAYLAKFDMGESLGLKAFSAAMMGGYNTPKGALLGGLMIGVLENLVAAYVSASYKEAVALLLLMVVILIRPHGLLGKAAERRV